MVYNINKLMRYYRTCCSCNCKDLLDEG